MRNLKVGGMKHTQLFCQRIQDHKKALQDTLEGNSFVTTEVPIQGLYNVGQCVNACGGFSKGKNFSSRMNVMDYDMPELVVFIQEDTDQFVKDISFDKRVSLEGKCLSEDCEFHHNIIPCFFDPNMKRSSGSNLQTMEIVSTNSNGSECASQNHFIKDAMKKYDCRKLMMEAEVELDSGDNVSTDHATKKITSQRRREFFRKEPDISRSIKNWQINSFLGSIGSRVEFAHCADYRQVSDGSSMSTPKMRNLQSLTVSGKRQIDYPEKASSVVGCAATSSSASHQSNDSTSSTHSFAFPILPAEWNGSPVRMMEGDKSQSTKQWRKKWFLCCKC